MNDLLNGFNVFIIFQLFVGLSGDLFGIIKYTPTIVGIMCKGRSY